MTKRDVIVIGASTGGVEALQKLVRGFPADLPASVFVVLHVPARNRSLLADILSRSGPLRAVQAEDGQPIEKGCIYVAPPDRHLVIARDHIHLTSGPKEQHHRPGINVTFRSAAAAYGERVAGVILSGELDDGTAGLWEIERRGGASIVQNPEEAVSPSMPLSALREVAVQHVVSLDAMAPLLARLASPHQAERDATPTALAEDASADRRLTDLTCPDCRGTIWEVTRGASKDYQCRVGHTFSTKGMLATHTAAQETMLYAALVSLLEGASLASRLAEEFEGELAHRMREEAQRRQRHAELLRQILRESSPVVID